METSRKSDSCRSQTHIGFYFPKHLAIGCTLAAWFFFTTASLATDEKSIQRFRDAIIKLGPDVDPAEADEVSTVSHQTARQLKKEYRAVGPAVFQNFLVNVGAR